MRVSHLSSRVSGSNQVGVRQYNERVTLSLIRESGALTKAEIAKVTNLTPQTVSGIINRLNTQGLLLAEKKRRGAIGQPSTPYSLNADGAYSIGIKIGRASLDVILMDFRGAVRESFSHSYDFPTPDVVFEQIENGLEYIDAHLTDEQRDRCEGVGVASPFQLESWAEEFSAQKEKLKDWERLNILEEVSKRTNYPVTMINDATAACLAEITFGNPQGWSNFVYIYAGTFIGGGVVLNGQIWSGSHANAGAFASMLSVGDKQLIHDASLRQLDLELKANNLSTDFGSPDDPIQVEAWPIFSAWVDRAGPAIAHCIVNSTALLDPQGVIVDGRLRQDATALLVEKIEEAMSTQIWDGIHKPRVVAGNLGFEARAMGGAVLPLHSSFGIDDQVFLKPVDSDL